MKIIIEVQLVEDGGRKLAYHAKCNDCGLAEEVAVIGRIADFVRAEAALAGLPITKNVHQVHSVGGAN